MSTLLRVHDLAIEIGGVPLLHDVSFQLDAGHTLGLVGESGSGKSLLALALIGLLPASASVRGRIEFEGRDLLKLNDLAMDKVRGHGIAAVFQEPMTALNPAMRAGTQIAEALRLDGLGRRAALSKTVRLLDRVRIPDPEAAARAYPHQLSGGQRQRVAIAMAIARSPRLLLADEPTTALDAGVQAEILDLLAELVSEKGMALILVSHDLAVIARAARRTLVLYSGTRFEEAPTAALIAAPQNPYTRALTAAMPRERASKNDRLPTIPGRVPSAGAPMPGCRFAPRCGLRIDACEDGEPEWRIVAGHGVRCLRAGAVDQPR
ncbi:ABC transporter ATP-binding protein [Aureimonas mangrovi]|uniref:ABC transporter ATP-binding protein n=1 Tax=Aureimonas mangrovi TaxID=2758041 RepID=UPI001FEC2C9F|nr:ABC transporter ATP-binding protein [Aureimonas mangrovi]